MHTEQPPTSWFDIPEARPALAGHPLAMRAEWIERVGRATCEQCGQPIHAGEPFLLTPYCPMGGALDLAPEALAAYADTLEVSARHAACGAPPDEPPGMRSVAHGWRLSVLPPFSLEKTVRAFQRLPVNETQIWRDDAFLRTLPVAEQRLPLRITQPAADALEIAVPGAALSEAARSEISARVAQMLAVDRDLRPFAQRIEALREPPLREGLRTLFHRIAGLQPPRYPDLFETMINTLLFQQISLHAGTALLNRLARRFGEGIATPWGEVRRLPTASELEGIPEEALGEIGFSRHKSRALIALARRITAGELEVAELAGLATPRLEERLVTLPGIGPWSARVIMLRGFGRLDTFPTGDSGVAKTLRAVFDVGPAEAETLQGELLETLAPYQGYLYFCLLGWRLLQSGVMWGRLSSLP